QKNPKLPIPNSAAVQSYWSLRFGAFLVFGSWCLEFSFRCFLVRERIVVNSGRGDGTIENVPYWSLRVGAFLVFGSWCLEFSILSERHHGIHSRRASGRDGGRDQRDGAEDGGVGREYERI